MAQANDVLNLARTQLGTKESPANSNNVIYNTAYYGKAVSGSAYPWCCVFMWWLFHMLDVPDLFYGGGKTASCGALNNYAKQHGQLVTKDFLPGDLAFMKFSGNTIQHIGIIESVNATGVVTIEGNTGTGNDANGGEVMRRNRPFKYIVSAYRPKWEEEEMTGKQIYDALNEYTSTQTVPAGVKAEYEECIRLGLTDGSNPCKLVPAWRAVIFAKRAAEKTK